MLPSGNEMPTGSSKLEIQVSRRFDEVERVGLQKMEGQRETLYLKSMHRRDSILNCRCAVLLMSQLCFARQ